MFKWLERKILLNFLSRNKIYNRPLEGEIVKIDSIKIKNNFKKPNNKKLARKRDYFNQKEYYQSEIVLSNNNWLLDGYTTYILAKEAGYEYITIKRK